MNTNLCSKDYRHIALDALRGNWPTAILTYFVASLLGATVVSGSGSANFELERYYTEQEIDAFFGGIFGEAFLALLVVFAVASLAYTIIVLVIGGAARMGYASYNLNLVDRKEAKFNDLFSHMNRKWEGFCMNFFIGLLTLLWSLLLVIPGIVKSFAYSMTPYIMAERPELTAREAIDESQSMMDGHKWRLFKLHLSFLGWTLLAAAPVLIVLLPAFFSYAPLDKMFTALMLSIPLSVGFLFLQPYIEAAQAAFYRDISTEKPSIPVEAE